MRSRLRRKMHDPFDGDRPTARTPLWYLWLGIAIFVTALVIGVGMWVR